MLFHTIDYLLFLIAVVVVFHTIPRKLRWVLLLLASYVFYASWNPLYLFILVALTLVAYATGILLERQTVHRNRVMAISIALQLAPLAFYKYLNFFTAGFNGAFDLLDISAIIPQHDFVLPLGLSFFTFQSISYCVDVKRGYYSPERHLGHLAVYTAFFPQLLAGPIERAKSLLPQLKHQNAFNAKAFTEGCQLILWGVFKKLVIAERLAVYVNEVHDDPTSYQGVAVWLASFFFWLQVFADFSAYTDIARGSAKWLGIELSFNFGNRVYLKPSITAFWREWHITLTSWFRDYVYFPLSKLGRSKRLLYFNLILVYVLVGFWHGATLGFLVWGLLNGIWVVYEQATKKWRFRWYDRLKLSKRPAVLSVLNMGIVFVVGSVIGLWFRANSLESGWLLFKSLFVFDLEMVNMGVSLRLLAVLLVFMDIINYFCRKGEFHDWLAGLPRVARWVLYIVLIELVIHLGIFGAEPFYYFRF